MKKIYAEFFIAIISLLIISSHARGQCLPGTNAAVVKWDQLDYLTRNGTYSAYVTNAMMQTQFFTLGVNRLSINFPIASMTTNGENTTNTAEAGSNGTGADVEYNGNGTITITFDNVVNNFRFSLYDIDLLQSVRVTALDGAAAPLTITMAAVTAGVITVAGSGGTTPTANATNTAVANNDTRGSLNISIAGTTGLKSVTIIMGLGGGAAGNFWVSDLNACVTGTFPNNYYISQQPYTGQPAYYLLTPDNNSVYLVNPLTGRCDWLFAEPSSPWVNSTAYDHVNKVLYYVRDNPSPVLTNKMLKKYDFNTETISTVVNDITTLGIPIYDIVVESAGAAFYNGSLFIGIEGTNGAKNSSRESIIWRIDFDAALNSVKVAQVFARPADNGSGLLTHDWGDFTIKDGTLYDFNTGNSGSTSQFVHFNMQSANTVFYNTNGNPAPIQAGQTWDGRLYWTGGQSPETGRVARYNENGTIGAKIVATVTICSPPWVGRAGDASDPFRPKSDFGDAPASYDPIAQERATHEYDCNLRLGATFDREWVKTPSADASADGADEDGIATVSLLPPGIVSYVQDVQVYNNTGVNATLAGWLDYNGNGVFDATEGVTLSVPSTGTLQTVTLSWPGINNTLPLGSTTFLRLRLTSASNGMTVNNATMWRANGEVEDYPVYINVVLPINLLSFTAENEADKRVLLNWETGQETNFKGFDIERSKDGLMWQKIGYTPANNNGSFHNEYSYYDYDPIPGQSFYRLKMLDVDGQYKYSYVANVTIKQQYSGLKIFPNPVMHTANMQVISDKNEAATLYVTDANGKRMMQKTISLKIGSNTITIDGWDRFAAGMYVVQLVTADTKMNGKVLVQPK